jgi:1,3-beta-galactosyl-N-acetylhexosamine phosphorylase
MDTKKTNRGFTLPAETGMEDKIKELVELWGVDAVRDSDGTELSQQIIDMGLTVYSTVCLVRQDNEWAKANRDALQQVYLMSERQIAEGKTVGIPIMERYFAEQLQPDSDHDVKKWWEVRDRTAGTVVPPSTWEYDTQTQTVTIHDATPWHAYTCTFLAWQIWEPTSMYNHITNHWTTEHKLPIDVRIPKARIHMARTLEAWLEEHPKTDVVRFTTFFYQFDLIYNELGKERRVDWFGYGNTVSPLALEQFEQEYGYALTPEDFVDEGMYNTPFKNPSQRWQDWMEFNQKFVSDAARELVEIVHRHGRKAIMFLGDHWAGTEPYGKYFPSIGLDAVVGAAGDGVTTRMIADIPVPETEARMYPYFFPDIFHEGGDPVGESTPIWMKVRRAMMRHPMQRIGYGGYLSLACKFPEFIDHVTEIVGQFRALAEHSENGQRPGTASFKVAVLNSWGRLRTWMTHQVAHSLWNQRCYSYLGVIEALAGFPFDIEFISFDDILEQGIPEAVKVIINAGDAGTSWCGGDHWADPRVQTTLREWVAGGGGFIGVGEPTACATGGVQFQLQEVLGVQQEKGFTASTNKPVAPPSRNHFICHDISGGIDYGEGTTMVYPCAPSTLVHDVQNRSVSLATNTFGAGRSVYIAGLPFNPQNARLLLRSIFWTAGRESEMFRWFSSNPDVECHYFPDTESFVAVNNATVECETVITTGNGSMRKIVLAPMEAQWHHAQS